MKTIVILTAFLAVTGLLFAQAGSVDEALAEVADGTAKMLSSELSRQNNATVLMEEVTFEGRPVMLGEYLAASIPIRLVALSSGRISIATRPASGQFALRGQIFALGDDLKLLFTLISPDSSVVNGVEFDLPSKTAMASMLKPSTTSAYGSDQYEPDTFDRAVELAAGQNIRGRLLQPAGDSDWFRVVGGDISEPVMVTVSTVSNMDTYIEIYSEDDPSLPIAENDDGDDGNARVGLLLEPGTALLVKVRGYDTSTTGPYEFVTQTVSAPADPLEPNNNSESASPLGFEPTRVTGHIFPLGDEDWYEIAVPGNVNNPYLDVQITSDLDTYMSMYSDQLDLLAEDDDSGSDANARITYGPVAPGRRYYVSVIHYENSSIGEYRISATMIFPEHDAYEPDNDWDSASQISLSPRQPVRQRRNFSTHMDSDWIQFRLDSPATAVLLTTGNTDTTLYLYDEQGDIIQESDDDGSDRNGYISRFLAPGTYRLEIRQFAEDAEDGAEYGFEARLE